MVMNKKISFSLFGILSVLLVSFVFWAPADKETFCWLDVNMINNNPWQSRTLKQVEQEFNKSWNRRITPNKLRKDEQRSPSVPVRVDCKNPTWFNNWIWQNTHLNQVYIKTNTREIPIPWDELYDFNKKTHVKKDIFKVWDQVKSELWCYNDFIDFASKADNYKTQIAKFDQYKSFLNTSEVQKVFWDISTPEKLANYIKNNFSKNTGFIDYKKVWLLQIAVNMLGCDQIRADWKLWNYTIKSFCVCGTKPQEKCISLEEPKVGDLKVKWKDKNISLELNVIDNWKFEPKSPITVWSNYTINLQQEVCSNDKLKLLNVFPDNINASLFCKWELQWDNKVSWPNPWGVPLCCPWDLPVHSIELKDGKKKVASCCINPKSDNDVSKCVNLENVNDKETCWFSDATYEKCKLSGWEEVPFCPCYIWNKKVPYIYRKWDWWKWWWQCRWLTCDDIPVDSYKDLNEEICANFKDIANKQKMPSECEYKWENINIENCFTCEDWSWPVWYNWQRFCDKCPKWERFDFDKWKCVCDPTQKCCWIKLNTNVPWIGRCIEFWNTNDINKTYNNEYWNWNTTITVNILNAFPVLMLWLWKILMTLMLIWWIWMIIYAWTLIASWDAGGWKSIIKQVAIWVALIGASWIILHFINPNFFL